MNRLMQAWKIDPDLDLDHCLSMQLSEIPSLKQDQVLLKLEYVSLNHRDVWIAKKSYPGLQNTILGSDGYGQVVQVYADEDNHMIGQSYVINPSVSHWTENAKLEILGLPKNGTFAQYIAIDKKQLFLPPKHLNSYENAAIGLVGLTAYRIVFSQAQIKPQERVLITGIGGSVAQFCTHFCALSTENITVTSSDNDKTNKIKEIYNFIHTVNYRTDAWNDFLQSNVNSFDLIIDSSGHELDRLLYILKPRGQLITYGATASSESSITLRKVFAKEITIIGSTMGNSEEFAQMLALMERKNIRPIIDKVISITKLKEEIDRMYYGKQFGKTVLDLRDLQL